MIWNFLEQIEQVKILETESKEKTVLVFKHSTRCSTSRMVLDRLERNWNKEDLNVKPYFLDLLTNWEISNALESNFNVRHESPQVLIISNGKSIFDCSHFDIELDRIKTAISN